jgi:hypothetical protein
MITALQLYNVLCDQFPDLHANALNLKLQDMLQQPVPCNCLTRIAAAKFWVPIDGVTHHNHNLQIPDSNLDGITTIYITDLRSWIMFIQSNVEQGKAYAWKMMFPRMYMNDIHIRPMNTVLKSEGWSIAPHNVIKSYVRTYADACLREAQDYLSQHPVTIGIHPSTNLNTQLVVKQRATRFSAQWPQPDPALDELETEIMNQILNSCSDPQTN